MSKVSQEELMNDGKDFLAGIPGIEQEETPKEVAAEKKVKAMYENAFVGMARKIILIHGQEGPVGNKPVFVAVNGRGFSIPREIEVSIPVAVIAALDDAVETKYYRDLDEGGREVGPIKSRNIRRFNYSVK
jgi:hypothetical protein